MQENQETITRWSDETFGPIPPAAIARRMRLEVEELLEGFDTIDGRETISGEQRLGLQIECGDIYIMLCQVAEKLGANLQNIAEVKMSVNRERRWWFDPEINGHRHVKSFIEAGSGLEMHIGLWYIISDADGCYTAEGFATQEDAVVWAKSPEGIEAGAQDVVIPKFMGADGWEEMGVANVVFARDLFDFWAANPIEDEE